MFGEFVENRTEEYRHASRPGKKKYERISPKPEEVVEFRRAIIEGTPFSRKNIRTRQHGLKGYGRKPGERSANPRKLVQTPDGKVRESSGGGGTTDD